MDQSVRELRLTNLAKGRGKRPPTDSQAINVRVPQGDKERLEAIAIGHQCYHGSGPGLGALLHKIAMGELILVDASAAKKILENLS